MVAEDDPHLSCTDLGGEVDPPSSALEGFESAAAIAAIGMAPGEEDSSRRAEPLLKRGIGEEGLLVEIGGLECDETYRLTLCECEEVGKIPSRLTGFFPLGAFAEEAMETEAIDTKFGVTS